MFFTILFTIFCTAVAVSILAIAASIFFYPEDTKIEPQIKIRTTWTPKENLERGVPLKKSRSKK